MTVMKLLMPLAGLIKARYKGDKADIDSAFFKLHYRTSATILFLSAILVTANNLIGKTIDCISGDIPGNVLNTYCWIMSTFSIPSRNAAGKGTDYAYQGVEPGFDDRAGLDGEDRFVRHAYYQWVPFVLFLQGVMFYLPHYFWKMYEDERMKKITDGLRGRTLNIDDRKDACETLVKYVKETFHENNWYAGVFFICDLMNLFNTIFQMYFINLFLGGMYIFVKQMILCKRFFFSIHIFFLGVFMSYGTQVLYWADMDPEERTDPLVEVFPRLTKCTFHKYGPSGTIERHDAMCLLALNIISEKVYVFLWFWLIILAVLTAIYLVYTLAVIFLPALRKQMLSRNAKVRYDDGQLDMLMRKADMGDWFVLFLLSKNLDSTLFKEFIGQLTEKLKTEP